MDCIAKWMVTLVNGSATGGMSERRSRYYKWGKEPP